MKVLAIDASTKSTGVALFDNDKLIKYDCLQASSNDLIKRIQKITIQLKHFIEKEEIDKIILEEVRMDGGVKNPKTYKALMWLQAAMAFLFYELKPNATIEYIYPSSWRAKCGIKNGRGVHRKEAKELDIAFVKEIYSIEVNDDIADAIGIGHAYVHNLQEEYFGDMI